eukprot:jgi/Bigna1/75616/fgenesh1_pg.36_\
MRDSYALRPPEGSDKCYPTVEDIDRLREELVIRKPKIRKLLETTWTRNYLKIVMTRPSKEDSKVMRSFDYTLKKLCEAFDFRNQYGVEELFPTSCTKLDDIKEIPTDILKASANGSIYWRDYDIHGRPILWVRNNRKNWRDINLEAETRLHIWMLEWGLRTMPPGVSQFIIVAGGVAFINDAREMSMRQLLQLSFIKMLMKVFMKLYPDRIAHLMVGPVSYILRKLYSVVKPLIPRNLQGKIKLLPQEASSTLQTLISEDSIPIFFDGPSSHEDLMMPSTMRQEEEEEEAKAGKETGYMLQQQQQNKNTHDCIGQKQPRFNYSQMQEYQLETLKGMISAFESHIQPGSSLSVLICWYLKTPISLLIPRELSDMKIEDENYKVIPSPTTPKTSSPSPSSVKLVDVKEEDGDDDGKKGEGRSKEEAKEKEKGFYDANPMIMSDYLDDDDDDFDAKGMSQSPVSSKSPTKRRFERMARRLSLGDDEEEEDANMFKIRTASHGSLNLIEFARKLEEGVKIKDRRYRFRKFKSCFIGREAVSFLVEAGLAADRQHALSLGARLSRLGVIAHVLNRHTFKDDYLYYRFQHTRIRALSRIIKSAIRNFRLPGEALMRFAAMGLLSKVKKSISKAGGLESNSRSIMNIINFRDVWDWTPLMQSCSRGHLDVTKYLVGIKAEVNARTKNGSTALIYASRENQLKTVKFLVETGKANVNAASKWGGTALVLASVQGHMDMVKYLVNEAKADLSHRALLGATNREDEWKKKTAFEWAKEEGQKDVCSFLAHQMGIMGDSIKDVCSFLAHQMDMNGHVDYSNLDTKKRSTRSYSMPTAPYADERLLPIKSSSSSQQQQQQQKNPLRVTIGKTKKISSDFKMEKHDGYVKNSNSSDTTIKKGQQQQDQTASTRNSQLVEEINTQKAKLEARNNMIIALTGLLLSMNPDPDPDPDPDPGFLPVESCLGWGHGQGWGFLLGHDQSDDQSEGHNEGKLVSKIDQGFFQGKSEDQSHGK